MDRKRTVFLLEHGINTLPSDWRDWTNRGAFHVHQHTPHAAQSLEYFAGPLLAHFLHRRLARQFGRMLKAYADARWRVVVAAHSNGTRIAVEGMRAAGWPPVAELHLLCGAVDADFERNGLNQAVDSGRVGRVVCYAAGRDLAMRVEDTLLGRRLFGVRSEPLGLYGPLRVRKPLLDSGAVSSHDDAFWRAYGHSGCWRGRELDRTMCLVEAGSMT